MDGKRRCVRNTAKAVGELFLTDAPVYVSGVEAAVPEGFRIARLDEFALHYKDFLFRHSLYLLVRKGENKVWAGDVGLCSSGPHSIDYDGKFAAVGEQEWNRLQPERRSMHTPGNGRILLSFGNPGFRYLDVDASIFESARGFVAYVRNDATTGGKVEGLIRR